MIYTAKSGNKNLINKKMRILYQAFKSILLG